MGEEILYVGDDDRYGRLRLISWWRQDKLRASKVLVVGAGALGNEVLKNLALIGVGHVFLIDYDTIEASNLTRSVLFRAGDKGKRKVECAAAAVRDLNPDVEVTAIQGNVIIDLGLGLFGEMDVVIACLDNREARLWVNRQCWKMGTPWVDGAIQEINGVCKVFVPPDSACYECAMTEADYRLLNLKYSCPLLKREDISEGKVPTAPTIASIVAGLQTQEALKLLHGMDVDSGAAMIFNGTANNFYKTRFQRKEDCLSHETYPEPEDVDLGTGDPATALLKRDGRGGAAIELDRDFLISVRCPKCDVIREIGRPLTLVTLSEGKCTKCSQIMLTDIVHRIDAASPVASRALGALGVAPFDVVKVIEGRDGRFYRLRREMPRGEGNAGEHPTSNVEH